MATSISAPRGTKDVLPSESYKWQFVEGQLKNVCESFGYAETRTPTFEYTEVFQRGVGDSTDVVDKEMYTMIDKGNRSITLRPEGTAGVVRSFMENGVLVGTLPVRSYYLLSCFRYEAPQAGRYREFHQLGVELFGAPTPDADTEIIQIAHECLNSLHINHARLELNSIGCPNCRPNYRKALYDYFSSHKDQLCDTCLRRLETNPMRILDCKNESCKQLALNAPRTLDYLCEECEDHFHQVQEQLEEREIPFVVNPRIVRGLDYYTKTVFEFVHEGAGAQGVVCGGGRYDHLVETLGGPSVPGIGFGMGIERLLNILAMEEVEIPHPAPPQLFLAFIGEKGYRCSRLLANELKKLGVYVLYDINKRSLKAQMKYANKLNAQYTIVLGDEEVEKQQALLKNMSSGEEVAVDLDPVRLAAAF